MEMLRQEMRSLVAKLESAFPQPGSIEDATLYRLRTLCGVADQAREAAELNDRFVELRQYWLDSIDWCSQLSKEIEKLLIIQEELATGGRGGPVSR
ncbi:MAG: hypothetical protein HF981_12470 [Desulfobacteraceae bacterium]|nr:hypothetical protein [Desulfobacteraceae bacterium]MBC2751194.1 hypothetical protein [Desulfobacteraceae bacterium]